MATVIALTSLVLLSPVLGHPPFLTPMLNTVPAFMMDSNLAVKKMLRMTTALEDNTFSAGGRVTLHCTVVSTPSATIYWEKNGQRVQGDAELNMKEKILNSESLIIDSGISASKLSIPCAQRGDSGNYKCVAFNGNLTVHSSAKIVINGRSTCLESAFFAPPAITQWTESRFENDGNTATLMCRANKLADFTWKFNNERINYNDGRHEIQSNGDLMIRNIGWNDMGVYSCVASNEYGNDQAETFLYPAKEEPSESQVCPECQRKRYA